MKFLKDIKEYKFQLINEASVISKKNIDSYIDSYYDKYDTFSYAIKNIVNKYIYKNILEKSLIKKYTIDGVLDKEGFNKEIKEIVDSADPEIIIQNAENAPKEIINKSISEYIYNNILKILSIRKRKDELLCEIDPITTSTLAPFFIKFNIIDNVSKNDLQLFYDSLNETKYSPNYFIFLDFNKFKNVSFEKFKKLYDFIVDRIKGNEGKDDSLYFKQKSGNELKFSLVDYIGKESKENYPSWWPFDSGSLKPPSSEINLSNYLNKLINDKDIIKNSDNITDDDIHLLIEKIGDKLTELDPLIKIYKFVRLMPKFEVKNDDAKDLGETIDLKTLFYNIKTEELQNQTAQVAEINYRKGSFEKSKTITKKSMRYRNVVKILEEAEDELGSIIPTTPDTTLEEIDDINRKFGKQNGVEILWQDEDKLITQVNSYEANYILNGAGTKYPDQKRSDHCIAWPNGRSYWNNYVGIEGPVGGEYKLQFYIYDFTREARKSNKWTIGITLGLSKRFMSGGCQDSRNNHIDLEKLQKFFNQENIPFFEVLDKIDPNDKGTKYEGMTLFEKHIFIKKKQIETNLKLRSGDLTISEIEEALEEGANINAYNGILIKKSINDLEKLKYLLSKGAVIQYLFDELDKIIKDNNFELLRFLIKKGLDVSEYKLSSDLLQNYQVFKIILDAWGDVKLTNDNLSKEVFNSIKDIRVLSLLDSRGFDIKKAIGVDLNSESRDDAFISNNRDNYHIIKFLFDKGILKYNPNNPYYIFPYNLDVYNLFILNGYPINYQDSTVLYNFAKNYKKSTDKEKWKKGLNSILDLYLTENLIYNKSCPECNGYGIVNDTLCPVCKSTGLSNQLGNYKSYIEKKGNISCGTAFIDLFIDEYFSDKFINVLIKLHKNNVNVSDLFIEALEDLEEPKKSEINNKISNLGII